MNWFESFIYGIISGITTFLPISTSAHQMILLKLFGESQPDPLLNLFIHVALILAVLSAGRNLIDQLQRQRNIHSRRSVHSDSLEVRFLKNALFPLIIAFFLFTYSFNHTNALSIIGIFLFLNGLILFLQSRMIQGNKDERAMSVFDSILIGISGALSVFSGISPVSTMLAAFTIRGVDKQKAGNWVILLSIPILVLFSCKDILNIISGNGTVNFLGNLIGYILAIVGSYAAGYLSVMLMKSIALGRNYLGFAYYSWGVSLFSFILYLTIV